MKINYGKLKNKIVVLISVSFLGCTTTQNRDSSFFIVKHESEGATEIVVTPDRVLLQCVDSEENPDEGGRYLFMIQMLDEGNTVATTMLGPRPDKKGCEEIYKRCLRVLKKAKRVYIGSWGKLTNHPVVENRKLSYAFPGHGTFYDNGRILQFGVITNDRGECYNPTAWDYEPCLSFPFPLEKYEKKKLKSSQ